MTEQVDFSGDSWVPPIPSELHYAMRSKLSSRNMTPTQVEAELDRAWREFLPTMRIDQLFGQSFAAKVRRTGNNLRLNHVDMAGAYWNHEYSINWDTRYPTEAVIRFVQPSVPNGISLFADVDLLLARVESQTGVLFSELNTNFSLGAYIDGQFDNTVFRISYLGEPLNYMRPGILRLVRIRERYIARFREDMRIRRNNPPISELPRHARKMAERPTGGGFVKWYNDRYATIETEDRVISTLPVAEHGTLSSRRWGIEVELAGARNVGEPKGWERKGDGSLRSAYDESPTRYIAPEDCEGNDHNTHMAHFDGENWVQVENPDYSPPAGCYYCGEVEDDDYYADDEDTAEFVSPVLRSFHSRGLESILSDASSEPQNDSCGIHVHVEAKDLSARQIGNLLHAYTLLEPLLTESYQREEREYCMAWSPDELVEIRGKLYGYGDTKAETLPVSQLTGRRYKTVNILALEAHGTVEFRAMGPVNAYGFDYEYLIKWAAFCREVVNCAKADVPLREWAKVENFGDVVAIFQKYGAETSEITLSRLDFNPDVDYSDSDTYIKVEDRKLIEV